VLKVALGLAVVGIALYLFFGLQRPPESDFGAYHGPPDGHDVDPGDFVGALACAECHADQFARWASSTHGQAGGDPRSVRVLAPFDGTPIAFSDAVVVPTALPQGRLAFLVDWNGTTDTMLVEGVVGGGHMVGGGTQGFFTSLEDGTQRFVPFDWSRHEEAWFCNTRHPRPGEWREITPDMSLAECADWTPRRMLGYVEGAANCDTCHGSQIRTEFDPSTRVFRTELTGLEINCESCHGPGRAHVELAEAGGVLTEPDLALARLSTLDEEGSLDVCFRCHAVRLNLRPGDLPGERLTANASVLLPQLTDRPFLPDNRVRTFAYQLNHRGSGCYLDGAMTCVSCHEEHGQAYQDEFKGPLVGRFDDGQCLGCHMSKAEAPERHSFHEAGSEGSSCVACHMPFLQHPSVGEEVRYARSDHTIPVPRPGLDEQFGITSACAGCHTDVDIRQLATQVNAWYGELKPWRPLVDALVRAPAVEDAVDAAELLLQHEHDFPMAQAAALSQYLIRFLGPDMATLPAGAEDRLISLVSADDVDVAALAMAALHLARGDDPRIRSILRVRLEVMGNDAFLLRDRWAAALRYMGDVYRLRGAPQDAVRAYRRALEAVPEEPRALEGLGLALVAVGDGAGAEATFRASFEADSTRFPALIGLSRAAALQGRVDDELRLLEDAAERFPVIPLVQFQLGNAYLVRRDMFNAADAFRRTLDLDAALASPRLGLAQVLAAQGRLDDALAEVELALTFEPSNAQARQLLEMLQRR
jgi:tetratricopeptide (TPR) repeat protein